MYHGWIIIYSFTVNCLHLEIGCRVDLCIFFVQMDWSCLKTCHTKHRIWTVLGLNRWDNWMLRFLSRVLCCWFHYVWNIVQLKTTNLGQWCSHFPSTRAVHDNHCITYLHCMLVVLTEYLMFPVCTKCTAVLSFRPKPVKMCSYVFHRAPST